MENLITIRTASKMLGISRIRTYQLAQMNRFKIIKIDGRYFTTIEEIEKFKKERENARTNKTSRNY